MFGRFTKAWQENVAPNFFGNGADTNFSDVNPRHQVVIGTTFTPSPTWVINVLIGSGRWRENQNSPSKGLNATALGFSPSLVSQFQTETYPEFSVQNYATFNNRRYLNAARETHNLQLNITKERGAHSLKFGWISEVARLNKTDFNTPTFAFNRGLTSGPVAEQNSTTTGDAIASLLLGTGCGGSVPVNAATAITAWYHGAYFQDSWRATRRLTLHLGIRWEVQTARTERYNRFNNFDFDSPSPLAQRTGLPLKGGLVFVSDDDRGAWRTERKLCSSLRRGVQDHRQARVSRRLWNFLSADRRRRPGRFLHNHHLGLDGRRRRHQSEYRIAVKQSVSERP